jgi:hypothetical protein
MNCVGQHRETGIETGVGHAIREIGILSAVGMELFVKAPNGLKDLTGEEGGSCYLVVFFVDIPRNQRPPQLSRGSGHAPVHSDQSRIIEIFGIT